MYIRRKVFSVLEDEMGQEKYFSTTEYVYEENNIEQREFADNDQDKRGLSTGAKVGIGAGAVAAASYPTARLVENAAGKYHDKMIKTGGGDPEKIGKAVKRARASKKVQESAAKVGDSLRHVYDIAEGGVEKAAEGVGRSAKHVATAARMEAAELPGYLQAKKEEILGEIKDNKDRRKVAKAMKNHEKTVRGAVKEELAEAFNAPTVKRMWNGNYLKGKAEEATEKAAEKSKKAMSEKMRAVGKGVKGEELEKLAKSAANASKKAVNAKKVSEFVANHSKAISRGGMVAAPVAVAGTGYATYRAIKKHKDSKKESEKKND